MPAISQPHGQVNVLRGNTAVADQIHPFPKYRGRTFTVSAELICRPGKK